MSKPDSQNNLDALLAHMPEEMQRAAMRVLNEWGYPLPAEDSFPVRLALITRFQLWGFSQATARLKEERQTITRLLVELSALLTGEVELRKAFLRQIMAVERGEMQRLHTMMIRLRESQEGVYNTQEDFLRQLRAVLSRLPSPETVDKLARLRQSPDNLAAQTSLRRAAADLLRATRRLEAMQRRPAAPPVQPEIPVPAPLPAESSRSGRGARTAAVLVFLVMFANACAQHGGRPFTLGLVVWYVVCALVTALCFLL